MAERRMFAKTIIDSDVFLDMPLSTQALYFHLSMRADDEGFINNPKKVMRMIGASNNELDLLIAKRYILTFESGVVVIKHWKIHNYIQKDRFKATLYKEERQQIIEKENKSYTDDFKLLDTECIQNGDTGKVREGKSKSSIGKSKKEPKQSYHNFELVKLTEKEYNSCITNYGEEQTIKALDKLNSFIGSKGDKYKSHYHTLNSWVWESVKAVKLSDIKKEVEEVGDLWK